MCRSAFFIYISTIKPSLPAVIFYPEYPLLASIIRDIPNYRPWATAIREKMWYSAIRAERYNAFASGSLFHPTHPNDKQRHNGPHISHRPTLGRLSLGASHPHSTPRRRLTVYDYANYRYREMQQKRTPPYHPPNSTLQSGDDQSASTNPIAGLHADYILHPDNTQ